MKYKIVISTALAVLMSGCFGDNNQTILQWMPDMADSPTVKAQENYLDPPDNAVSMTQGIYPETKEESEEFLVMPKWIQENPQTLANGKLMYEIYCVICHGSTGKGESTLPADFPGRPDLTDDIYKKRGDGFFYHTITFGSVIMPSYGYAISASERWQIVKYLRTLQNAH